MVVGIAFASLLFGAVAPRFLGPEVEQVEKEAERIETVEEDVLAQVRDISARLTELQAALQRNR